MLRLISDRPGRLRAAVLRITSMAHAVRLAPLEPLRRGGNLLSEVQSPAVRPVRKLLPVLRKIRSAELGNR